MASTRQKLVDAGLKSFYRDGFRNTGLDQILSEVGITKTAFYKHFESKEDLMVEVLEHQVAWMRTNFQTLLRDVGGPSALGQLQSVVDVAERMMEGSHTPNFRGCIFINASMEFPLLHDPAHQVALRNQELMTQVLHDIAERAGAKEPLALAKELMLIMDGSYVSWQVSGNPGALDTGRRLVRHTLRAHLSEAALKD